AAGADGKMGGSYVGTDPEMYPLCCLFGVYHRNHRKQMVGAVHLGLYRPAPAAFQTDLSPFCHHIFGPVRLRDLSWRVSGPLALRRDSSHPSFPLAEEEIEKFSLSYSHRKCYNIRMISVTEEENKIGRINTHDAAICRHKKRISGLHPVL